MLIDRKAIADMEAFDVAILWADESGAVHMTRISPWAREMKLIQPAVWEDVVLMGPSEERDKDGNPVMKPSGVVRRLVKAAEWEPESDEAFIARVMAKDVPEAARAGAVVLRGDAIPVKDEYRNSWSLAGGKLAHDMGKARAIFLGKVRAARAPVLAALDVDYMRAMEAGGDAKAVADSKKALRDLPQTLDLSSAKSPADLEAMWPAELPR